MALTNQERVAAALNLLRDGLQPYVERELKAQYKDRWLEFARQNVTGVSLSSNGESVHWDAYAILVVMRNEWQNVFRKRLGQAERSYVGELIEVRNAWAHQEPFSSDDTDRALDTTARMLSAVSAPEAREVEQMKRELRRVVTDEQARTVQRRVAAAAAVEGAPQAGLRLWRELMTPHPDVASGRYQQAEFAADLAQVHRGEGAAEYRDPVEFFERTYLTEGLQHLLSNALRRLNGAGGDPVVELQTNFGGGKTHSMLALYHIVGGTPAARLVGMEQLLANAALTTLPSAKRAVLVGTALSPAQPRPKPDGVVTRTLWGEMAWQLGGSAGYALVAEADAHGVSPGSDALRDLFDSFGPCLVLIDEWVAYARQLYGVEGLPAGSFDANLTFAQSLTEAAKAVKHTLVVASIPSSDIEIGGEGGAAALERLRNTFGRMEAAWRPASGEEGFEIVRRRLFQPMTDPSAFAQRDAVVRAFGKLYRDQPSEFPAGCGEKTYEERLKAAYPIHPELFDLLYEKWSTLDRFQRTRGVLRLMAAVIHALWERQDAGLMILPASVPLDDDAVRFELKNYLDDPWVPVIEVDIDGPSALPRRLDRENPNLGRYSASRRVARTLFLGSAPTLHTSQRGLEDRSIKLGSAQPGESPATFGDALRRLTDNATHLYVDGRRYWFSTQPSVTRLAQDRAGQQDIEEVWQEIRDRVRKEIGQRGQFARVHAFPSGTGDVPDETEARLVILGPEAPHTGRADDSKARAAAQAILDGRGSSPRLYRTMLVFLAADARRLAELEDAVRQFRAWDSIVKEREQLNLDAFQRSQADTKRQQAHDTVTQRIPETYQWLLVPDQPDPQAPLEWQEARVQGQEPLAARASRKLVMDGTLITQFGDALLRMHLDRVPLWRGDHVNLKELWEMFATYLYLPRLRDREVLRQAVQSGVAKMLWETETFAYAQRFDEQRGRYEGLVGGQHTDVLIDGSSLLVKPEVARRQLDADGATTRDRVSERRDTTERTDDEPDAVDADRDTLERRTLVARRYHGTVELDPLRLSSSVNQIAEAVVQHLSGLLGATVRVTLEIEADIPDGVPDGVRRTVDENARTLRFINSGFEES
jgi:uncharacterized protein